MKSLLAALFALFAGLGLGYALFSRSAIPRLAAAPESRASSQALLPQQVLAEPPPEARSKVDELQEPPVLSRAPSDPGGEEDFLSAKLREYARSEIARGWSSVREEEITVAELERGLSQFEEVVRKAPYGIGRMLGEEQTRSEVMEADARRGGPFALLEKLNSSKAAPVLPLVRDSEAFEAMFEREHAEQSIGSFIALPSSKEEIEGGTTILFPSGCFLIGNLLERNRGSKAPADFTIAGAGMDATLIVLHQDFGSRGPIQRFEIRDCTIFTNHNFFFDQRQGAATLALNRVRVIGFDMGAGSSSAFIFNDGVLLRARDCRFEGGYGSSPAHGNLFDIRSDAFVARFDRCIVSRASLGLGDLRPNVTVLFFGCRLEDLLDRMDQKAVAEKHAGIELVDTLVTSYNKQVSGPLERDLNDLFPDWKERLVQ